MAIDINDGYRQSGLVRLAAFLTLMDTNGNRFAAQIGVSPKTVYRWLSGDHVPRPRQLKIIEAATNGAVRPADFYDVAAQQ
jgi:DNA-binding transcriptional regulator YdaS (Cro superfamily)